MKTSDMTLEAICLQILGAGDDLIRQGEISRGRDLCDLADALLLTMQAKEIAHEFPSDCLPPHLREVTTGLIPS